MYRDTERTGWVMFWNRPTTISTQLLCHRPGSWLCWGFGVWKNRASRKWGTLFPLAHIRWLVQFHDKLWQLPDMGKKTSTAQGGRRLKSSAPVPRLTAGRHGPHSGKVKCLRRRCGPDIKCLLFPLRFGLSSAETLRKHLSTIYLVIPLDTLTT